MINLLQETIEELKHHGLTPENVYWVGSEDGKMSMSWKAFSEIANIEYNNGYGGQEIAKDLVIVGIDWWLAREEYDGAEGWKILRKPISKNGIFKSIETLKNGDSWATLEEMNSPGGKYGDKNDS